MEARWIPLALVPLACLFLGASYRTANFVVSAPTQEFATQVGNEAERLRRELAISWTGEEMSRWRQPCPIHLQVGPHLGAGGATSFVFDKGEVFGWKMTIQGSAERILDSVLPHEVTHTVFATHFRRPLPRWADEGACTTVEHESERSKQDRMLIQQLKTRRGIAFSRMFAMKDYPQDVMPLYSQGYSLARFLIAQGGRRKYIAYVEDGMDSKQWGKVTQAHYGYRGLGELQNKWLSWVREGSPAVSSPVPSLARADSNGPATSQNAAQGALASQPEPAGVAPEVLAAASAPVDNLSAGSLVSVELGDKRVAPPAENRSKDGLPWAAPASAPKTGAVASQPPRGSQGGIVRQVSTQLSRPQTPQKAKQIILEWDGRRPGPIDTTGFTRGRPGGAALLDASRTGARPVRR